MFVTLSGIVTSASVLQPVNALAPIVSSMEGSVSSVRPLQPQNALGPIVLTVEGNTTFVMPPTYWNAFSLTPPTANPPRDAGMVSVPDEGVGSMHTYGSLPHPRYAMFLLTV